MSGFIKLWRVLQEHELWREKRKFSRAEAWIDLLMEASFETRTDAYGRLVERGCLWTTHRKLSARWGWDKTKVARFLKQLQRYAQIRTRVNRDCLQDRVRSWTYMRIVNYEKYQGVGTDDGPQTSPETSPEVCAEIGPYLRRKKQEGRNLKTLPRKPANRRKEQLRKFAADFDHSEEA